MLPPRADDDTPIDTDALFEEGLRLFNAGEYFDAHEAWEAIWAEDASADRKLYQGLIQAAAAFHKLERGVPTGGARLLSKCLVLLRAYPDGRCGLRLDAFTAALQRCLSAAESVARGDSERFDFGCVPRLRRVGEGP